MWHNEVNNFVRMFRTFIFIFLAVAPMTVLAAPQTPEIFSRTFPDQNLWYKTPEVSYFSYIVPDDVVRIGLDISRNTPADPVRRLNDLYDTVPLDAVEFEDGVNFVNVQFFGDQAETDASLVGSYKVQIDNQPPQNITAEFRNKEIFVKAEDGLSGIAMYEVMVDGVSIARVDGNADGVTVLWSEQEEGKQVEVRAVDMVGNTSTKLFTATAEGGMNAGTEVAAPLELLVAILTLIAVSALLYAIGVRRSSRQREDELASEVDDTKKHVAKIFGALKGEVQDQLASLSARKRLTKREEEVLANMTAALTLSEQMIQEEIDDFDEE